MKILNTEFLDTSLHLKKYLENYGVDKYNTKQDLLLIRFLYKVSFNMLGHTTEKEAMFMDKYINTLKNSNPQIKHK